MCWVTHQCVIKLFRTPQQTLKLVGVCLVFDFVLSLTVVKIFTYLKVFVLILQGPMQEARWDQVHNQRFPLLQLGIGDERGGCRGYRAGEHQGIQDPVDANEPKLGPKLAVQFGLSGPGPFFSGPGQR